MVAAAAAAKSNIRQKAITLRLGEAMYERVVSLAEEFGISIAMFLSVLVAEGVRAKESGTPLQASGTKAKGKRSVEGEEAEEGEQADEAEELPEAVQQLLNDLVEVAEQAAGIFEREGWQPRHDSTEPKEQLLALAVDALEDAKELAGNEDEDEATDKAAVKGRKAAAVKLFPLPPKVLQCGGDGFLDECKWAGTADEATIERNPKTGETKFKCPECGKTLHTAKEIAAEEEAVSCPKCKKSVPRSSLVKHEPFFGPDTLNCPICKATVEKVEEAEQRKARRPILTAKQRGR